MKKELNKLRNVEQTVATQNEIKWLTELKKQMKPPTLTNDDLSLIVCGAPNDSPTLSPFASTFTKEKINKCFCCVGYVPFTRNCLKSEYFKDEVGEGTEDTTLKDLVKEYEDAKVDLKEQGFNVMEYLMQRYKLQQS